MSLQITETSLEELECRHRRENKELSAKVAALKKTVAKGDKRKKKEVAAEISALESRQAELHAAEIKLLTSKCPGSVEPPADTAAVVDTVDMASASQAAESPLEECHAPAGLYSSNGSSGMERRPGGKPSKAKQRLQRRAEELRRMQSEAEKEAEGMVDVAAIESSAIDRLVANSGLKVRPINADGHCLYSAIADQLCTYHSLPVSYSDMRSRAAQYMRAHRDDFMPFMAHDSGHPFSDPDYDGYCDSVESSAEWGGHQEITALSRALQLPVHVYQSSAPVLHIGDDAYAAKEPVRLSYHRHAYGLGEHYNSLHKIE
ncbi:OTU protein [Coemansia thaxteri]|uniref:OTU protein n=1 Tax=Coemansia thaxteri TaxID=2663907 RepID=A0A9W8BLQ3_9FUNG|nr:OTU protein [Coemansia thaxteri]KAJ2005846.1 OTU protein [Coemansia thaxteri]KAJ2465850.1 OTU protein [Coemansia sp. RSA 2322]KAJ2485780.1 OTU protein [Coemansia sp. RSA 2320]